MAYKCLHCSKIYEDASSEILTGCTNCKSKFFFYISKEKLEQMNKSKAIEIELDPEERQQIEQDVRDITGIKDEDTPVFLDFESVKIIKPGKYLLDLTKLFARDKPQVYKLEDGKYVIDLALAFKKEE